MLVGLVTYFNIENTRFEVTNIVIRNCNSILNTRISTSRDETEKRDQERCFFGPAKKKRETVRMKLCVAGDERGGSNNREKMHNRENSKARLIRFAGVLRDTR